MSEIVKKKIKFKVKQAKQSAKPTPTKPIKFKIKQAKPIEKNIFFITTDKTNMNECFKDNIEFVKKQNPSYNTRLIDFKDFEKYYKKIDKDSYDNYYSKLNKNIGVLRADYIRYVLLYNEGGVYMDLKSRPKIPLDKFIKDDDSARLIHWKHNQTNNWKREYMTSFMISKKNNIIFKKVIDKLHSNIDNYDPSKMNLNMTRKNVLNITGTHMFTRVLDNESLSKIRMIENEEKKKVYVFNACGDYQKKYSTPHYSKLKEHLVVMN